MRRGLDPGGRLSTDDGIAEALAVVPPAADPALGLTERELETLRLLAAGSSNRELRQQLFISPATADRHVANILKKLGVDSRAKATAYARRHGIG